MALNDDQILEMAKLPRGVAIIYQNDWVEPVLCHFDRFEDKRPYIKPELQNQFPEDIFYKHIFTDEGFKALCEEDVDSVLAWIENSKYARETKRILKRVVRVGQVTQEENQIIAYNLFDGRTVAKLLAGAVTEQEGIEKADYFIRNNTEINDSGIIQSIRQMIIQVIISQDSESDIAKRYVEYSAAIR